MIFSASDVDPPPQSSEENPNTTATLISNTNENGEGVHILVSNLQIITSAEFQVANITCVDDDDTDSDGRGTFTLRTLGMS